ncbi:MAG: hypothetical protein WCF12_15665 [Propionicimonas sp.]
MYYTASVGFAHGQLPYRDFLLLHPPGIVLALAPFAWVGGVIGDFKATVLSQVTFMLLGAASAVLVSWMLRSSGWAASLVGGLVYAVALPSVYAESSTWLEAPGSFFMLLGMALIITVPPDRPLTVKRVLIAGIALGISPTFKIWTIVPALAVVAWLLFTRHWSVAAWTSLGGSIGIGGVMLPFFASAPMAMWQMVVTDQLGRPVVRPNPAMRMDMILGFRLDEEAVWSPRLIALCAVLVVAALIALASRVGRFAVVMSGVTITVLLASPSWYNHYPTLATGPLAMVVGVAFGLVAGSLPRARWTVPLAVALVVATLAGYTSEVVVYRRKAAVFDAAALAQVATDRPGCVTANLPIALINNGLLRRNLARGCPVMADFRGYYYHLRTPGEALPSRRKSTLYQQFAIDYLGSGTLAVIMDEAEQSFDATTLATIHGWPIVVGIGQDYVREPTPR